MRAMRNPFCMGCFTAGLLACSVLGQQARPVAGASKVAPATAASTPVSAAAAEVLEAERKMEAAVVRGDVAYVDRVSAPDLSFTHGDGWTHGGQPLQVDDRKAFLKRVENKQYNVRDLDSVKVE